MSFPTIDTANPEYQRQKREEWMQRYGVKPATDRNNCGRLFGRTDFDRTGKYNPPGDDHGELWIRNGKPIAYTYQPYSLSTKAITLLSQFCHEHNLNVAITTLPAFHYYGHVLWVELTRKDNPLTRVDQ